MTRVHIDEERTADLGAAIGRLEAPATTLARDVGAVVADLAGLGVSGTVDPTTTLNDIATTAPGIDSEITARLAYIAACQELEAALGVDISEHLTFENLPVPDVGAVTAAVNAAFEASDGSDIRAALAGLTSSEAQIALESHPELVELLQGELPPRLPWYAAPVLSEQGAEIVPEQLVGDYLTGLAPEDRRLMVLLYPDLANINGVPPEDRCAGNRLNISAEILQETRERAEYQELIDDYHSSPRATGFEEGQVADKSQLIDFYRTLLDETPEMIGLDGLPVESDGHQVILFNPEQSQFAEVFGQLPAPGTEAAGAEPTGAETAGVDVGLVIPGTGANMSNIANTSARAQSFHSHVMPPGSSPTISWMGGPLPQQLDAALTSYANDLGPLLPSFVNGLGLPDDVGTVAYGHSYGGSILGAALREGLDIDSAVFVNTAGMGPGVDGVDDYAHDTDVFNVSVPGDWINYVQGMVHGADPDRSEGVIQVETGWADEAQTITMPDSEDTHSGPFDVTSTAFENMRNILQGDGASITLEGTHSETRHLFPPYGMPVEYHVDVDTHIDDPEYEEEVLTVE